MRDDTIRVCIGFDARETVAYHVLCHSIQRRASLPVAFIPIALSNLRDVFTRDLEGMQSTEFSFSRFLAPYLCGYEGWAVFMDCDMVCLDDIAKLWRLRDERYAAMCVKHDHQPKEATKFLGHRQSAYAKKNWSSVMLLNCGRCRTLTPDYVNTASGLELHQFHWLEKEDQIGELPPRWNHLVGYSEGMLEDQSLLHFTEGGPYFDAYADTKWADTWRAERDDMLKAVERPL